MSEERTPYVTQVAGSPPPDLQKLAAWLPEISDEELADLLERFVIPNLSGRELSVVLEVDTRLREHGTKLAELQEQVGRLAVKLAALTGAEE